VGPTSKPAAARQPRDHRRRSTEPTTAPRRQPIWTSLRAGLAFTWRQPLIRALSLSEATFLFGFAVTYAVQLVFFTRHLHLSPATIGVIFTIGSVGGLLGGLAAQHAGQRYGTGPTIIGGSVLRAAGIAAVPLAAIAGPLTLPLLIGSRLINAFGWTLWEVHQETTQQLATPPQLRGRVNAAVLYAVQGADALGGLAGASLAALLGVTPTLAIGATGALLGTTWLLTPKIRHLHTPPPPPADPPRR
jgi:predicted MFS family arabinose efflux permease